jgi:hypothetical protein
MLKAPEKYINSLVEKAGVKLNISELIKYYIISSNSDLHFIISEKDLDISDLLLDICKKITPIGNFTFKKGQKILRIRQARYIFKIQSITPRIKLISEDKNNTQ